MANLTSGYTRADVLSDGVSSAYLEASGGGDNAYYQLTQLAPDNEISVASLTENDHMGAPRGFGQQFTAKFATLNTDKTAIIKSLDAIGFYDMECILNGLGGTQYSSALITGAGTTASGIGLKWTFISNADYDKSRRVEFVLDRCIQLNPTDEWTLFTNTAPALGSQVSTHKLYALASMSQAGIIPAGFTNVQLCAQGSGNIGNESLGEIRNGKFTAELVTYYNKYRMSKGKAIKIDVEVEATQANKTELQLLKGLLTQKLEHKLTFLDGTVFSTVGIAGLNLGLLTTHTLKIGVSNDPSFIQYKSSGYLKLDVAGVWDSLWT